MPSTFFTDNMLVARNDAGDMLVIRKPEFAMGQAYVEEVAIIDKEGNEKKTQHHPDSEEILSMWAEHLGYDVAKKAPQPVDGEPGSADGPSFEDFKRAIEAAGGTVEVETIGGEDEEAPVNSPADSVANVLSDLGVGPAPAEEQAAE